MKLARNRPRRAPQGGVGAEARVDDVQPSLDAYSVSVTAAQQRGESLVARRCEQFRASAAISANASFVLDALETAGVPHIVVDAPVARPRIVAVSDLHKDVALAALQEAAQGRPVYASAVAGRDTGRPTPMAHLDVAVATSVLRVFEPYATPGGQLVAGSELGCDLEFWRQTTDPLPAEETGEPVQTGALVAPRPNRWVEVLHPTDHQDPTPTAVDGTVRRALAKPGQRHQLDVAFPVDAVYTWVDGDDPIWLARKQAAQNAYETAGHPALHEFAAHLSRFASYDELRYSLRSLEMYADWIRRVYVVTDDQVPGWLDLSAKKLRLVSHRELFGDRGVLPTFNSHAIESQLHRLDGLSDHYIYLNDDVFFGRPVTPGHFFHANGIAKIFTSSARVGLAPTTPADMPGMSAGKNNRDLLLRAFGVVVTNKFKHVPHAQCRETLVELEEKFPEVFAETAAHQFRRDTDYSIAASLHHSYGYQTRRALPARIKYGYMDISDSDAPALLESWLRARDQDVFCLNDHDARGMDAMRQAALVHDFLSAYFPLPSSFEK